MIGVHSRDSLASDSFFFICVYLCSFVVKTTRMSDEPRGELVIQTIAMPKDTNPNGDIFGGWLTSQMDLGSGILAAKTAQARVVTVAMERRVTHGVFTLVAVDEFGKPIPVKRDQPRMDTN